MCIPLFYPSEGGRASPWTPVGMDFETGVSIRMMATMDTGSVTPPAAPLWLNHEFARPWGRGIMSGFALIQIRQSKAQEGVTLVTKISAQMGQWVGHGMDEEKLINMFNQLGLWFLGFQTVWV